ncbi:MAG: ADOP family duplicated permease [Vicinamibacterales bacterium]
MPLDDLTRRALSEARADAEHERRRSAGKLPQLSRRLSYAAALIRILAAVLTVPWEKPMRNLGRDIVYGWRRLRQAPWLSLFAVLTLALGIGMTTAVYSVIHAMFDGDIGVRSPEEVVRIYHKRPPGSGPMISLSTPDFEDLRDRQTAFGAVMAFARVRQPIASQALATIEWGELVTGEYFGVLGIEPHAGRLLQPADDRPGAPDVVVLSHGFWQRAFGADRSAIGSVVRIGGRPFEIIGVAPESFRGAFMPKVTPSLYWVPLAANAAFAQRGSDLQRRDGHWLRVMGRLAPGRTIEDATTEVAMIAGQLDVSDPIGQGMDRARYPAYNYSRPWVVMRLSSIKIAESADRLVASLATTVLVVVVLVLLVACTNVANLLLARAADRSRDLAVRLSLGASRWRLAREQLVESGLLALTGGLLGLAVARILLVKLGGGFIGPARLTFHVAPELELSAVGVAAGATTLALAVFGVWPAWKASRADFRGTITGGGSHAALPRWRGRSLLIAGQVAVSVVLVAMAALSVRQMAAQARLETGIDLDRLAVLHVEFQNHGIEEERVRQIAGSLHERIARLPGVTAAAVSSGLPFGLTNPGARVTRLDKPFIEGTFAGHRQELLVATPEIFGVLGVEIVRGRALDARDTRGAEPVAVISAAVAREVFETTDVVGRQVMFTRQPWVGDPEWPIETKRIVGVASDTETGRGARESGTVYVPFAQRFEPTLSFVARTDGNPSDLVGPLHAMLRSTDSRLAPTAGGTGVEVAGPETAFLEATSRLTGVLGMGALILALVGLYGVLSHVVARRRREIGLRMALGATPPALRRMVMKDGLRPVLLGLAAGLSLGIIIRLNLTPLFSNLLPGLDAWLLAWVSLTFLLAGVAACYIPARRAAGVDPNVALRDY